MSGSTLDRDAWKRIVLQGMAPPAWLREDGPERAIVLSTRVRIMRNLRGHRFPHHAAPGEPAEVLREIKAAVPDGSGLQWVGRASPAERDYLVACRLVSHHFNWDAPGRDVLLDAERAISVMVNEEDHLRFQALAGGWALPMVSEAAEKAQRQLGGRLEYSHHFQFGYLAASPSNCGEGLRYSAMFHLIGLAHSGRLATVIRALNAQGIVVRGLYGEHSRAIGAFAQVSSTGESLPGFLGACGYLLEEEKRARAGAIEAAVRQKRADARTFVEARQTISLAEALRALAWQRWPDPERPVSPREVDLVLPELALLESLGEPRAGRARAETMRRVLKAAA